ncbi:hypothetical protein D3C78_775560 [compost metagenome]
MDRNIQITGLNLIHIMNKPLDRCRNTQRDYNCRDDYHDQRQGKKQQINDSRLIGVLHQISCRDTLYQRPIRDGSLHLLIDKQRTISLKVASGSRILL